MQAWLAVSGDFTASLSRWRSAVIHFLVLAMKLGSGGNLPEKPDGDEFTRTKYEMTLPKLWVVELNENLCATDFFHPRSKKLLETLRSQLHGFVTKCEHLGLVFIR